MASYFTASFAISNDMSWKLLGGMYMIIMIIKHMNNVNRIAPILQSAIGIGIKEALSFVCVKLPREMPSIDHYW